MVATHSNDGNVDSESSPPKTLKSTEDDTTPKPKRPVGRPKGSKSNISAVHRRDPFFNMPPPPPPPPPINNPYYAKFVEGYWAKYNSIAAPPAGSSPATTPPHPSLTLAPPPPHFQKVAMEGPPLSKKRKATPVPPKSLPTGPLPPLEFDKEFPINTDRPSFLLANPYADSNYLSDKQCYIRSRLLEVFLADDQQIYRGKQAAFPRQVGVRCVYCAQLPMERRAERSVIYPSSVGRFYSLVADIQHKHFDACSEIPAVVKQQLKMCTSGNVRAKEHYVEFGGKHEKMSPKEYWLKSATEMGFVDKVDETGNVVGVELNEGHSLIPRESLGSVVDALFKPNPEVANEEVEQILNKLERSV
jgi:hypothetical protein